MKKIGIDAGGSLIKIAYEERRHIHVKTYSNKEIDQLIQWLQIISPDTVLCLTGGKSAYLKSIVQQKYYQIDEFQAITEGTRYLLQQEKDTLPDQFLVVNIGTGTSIFHVTTNSHERLFGSGIGGGTLMGLGSLITGKKDFQDLIKLAAEGNSTNSDLLVKDIYTPDEAPILGNLTAANFGKAHGNQDINEADHMASIIRLIGESLILLATQAAAAQQVEKIVFTGSTLNGNEPLKNVLSSFRTMIPYEPVFLDKGAYVGAIGSLLI